MQYKIGSFNIENHRQLFHKNKFTSETEERGNAAAATIAQDSPHILGIIEASERINDHRFFMDETAIKDLNYEIAKSSHRRGKQDLVVYYRKPFEVVSIDESIQFYDDWIEDIDGDSIKEVLHFDRKPLEVRFRHSETGAEFLVIVISLKSKGVFSTADIHLYEHLALANRKKLYGQSKKLRERVMGLMKTEPELPIFVMGDMNDDPGMDHFEKILGFSAIETLMGDVYHPEQILHNPLWHLVEKDGLHKVWTTEFPDRIVANFSDHRAWLDHIFLTPNMLNGSSAIVHVPESGKIGEKTEAASKASDHYPVYCEFTLNE